jgi:hypothetical protein
MKQTNVTIFTFSRQLIKKICYIFQYDPPRGPNVFIQRAGSTARYDQGDAVVFLLLTVMYSMSNLLFLIRRY